MKRLLNSVIKGLEEKNDFRGRWCEHYSAKCKEYLESYGDNHDDCGHTCEYCKKYKWAIDRSKHYEEKLGIPWKEILKSWEDGRNYWFMNYYQEANQPLIDSENVFVFETVEELREKCGKQFICPCCKGISTDPYECNSGKKIRGKVCDWKSYGLFQFNLAFCYVKSERKGTKIFMPVSLAKENMGGGRGMTEPYLEDNRPTLEDICEEQEECDETCPGYKCCFGNRLKQSEVNHE